MTERPRDRADAWKLREEKDGTQINPESSRAAVQGGCVGWVLCAQLGLQLLGEIWSPPTAPYRELSALPGSDSHRSSDVPTAGHLEAGKIGVGEEVGAWGPPNGTRWQLGTVPIRWVWARRGAQRSSPVLSGTRARGTLLGHGAARCRERATAFGVLPSQPLCLTTANSQVLGCFFLKKSPGWGFVASHRGLRALRSGGSSTACATGVPAGDPAGDSTARGGDSRAGPWVTAAAELLQLKGCCWSLVLTPTASLPSWKCWGCVAGLKGWGQPHLASGRFGRRLAPSSDCHRASAKQLDCFIPRFPPLYLRDKATSPLPEGREL